MPDLIDIGANLTNRAFSSDLPQVLERATAADIASIIVTGTSVEVSREALELCRERGNGLFCTAGIHPHDAKEFSPGSISALEEIASDPRVVAVGECGLDYNRDYSPRDAQRRCFAEQVGLAGRAGLPLFLHERDASEDELDILRSHRDDYEHGVVHCFTGDRLALGAYLDLGLHIGITGWICDERRGQGLRDLVPSIPIDRLLVETDAPFLLPRTIRPRPKSRRNEPAHLIHVVKTIAALRDQDWTVVAQETTVNARRLFQLPE